MRPLVANQTMEPWLQFIAIAAATYVFFVVFAQVGADHVIFRPPFPRYRDGTQITKIPTADGEVISALHLPVPGASATLLYLHGNAEDLGDLLTPLRELQRRGFAVLAIDYRGYGTSPGFATEKNVYADAAAALRYLQEKLGVPSERVVIYGRSMGSGPAVELAVREPLRGLVIEGGFVSAFQVVTGIPILPGDRFRNASKIGKVRCPILIVHGTQDRTIPFSHGERLLQAAPSDTQHLWVDGAGHNDLVAAAGETYWAALAQLVARHSR